MKITTYGLGEGVPASSPGSTAFSISALPGQLLTGAQKWLHPSEVLTMVQDTASGQSPGVGILIGATLPLVLILSMLGGKRRRF